MSVNVGYRFTPRWRYITDITNSQYCVITTSIDHDYTNGQIVSFRVSKPYGMVQINELSAKVLSHTNDTITVDIDSSNFDHFIYPVSGQNTPPVVVPSASGVIPGSDPATVNLQDCFDNVRTL